MIGGIVSRVASVLRRQMDRLSIALGGETAKHRILRRQGMRIGESCRIYTDHFGGEPWLIRIGDHCTITSGVRFVTHDGSCWVLRGEIPNLQDFGPIVIEDNCFIGVNAVLLPGIRIGPDSIVAAGAVVTKDVPPRTVVGGVPARALMTLDDYRRRKLAESDGQEVPTDGRGRRDYLERKYRPFLDGTRR